MNTFSHDQDRLLSIKNRWGVIDWNQHFKVVAPTCESPHLDVCR
jgi:hypothetical protein